MANYGSEVIPAGPLQDMGQIDTIVGSVHDRDSSPAEFTAGSTGAGLGGSAVMPEEAPKQRVP